LTWRGSLVQSQQRPPFYLWSSDRDGVAAIVTGVSGAVAQAMVTLGVDIAAFNAVGDLQRGIEAAERLLGYRVVRAQGLPA
jgi:hypothetical protein